MRIFGTSSGMSSAMSSAMSSRFFAITLFALVWGSSSACQQQASVANTNTVVAANANTAVGTLGNSNTNSLPATTADGSSTIETREPDRYRATLVVTAETSGGQRALAIPPFSVEVARNGADRRYAVKLPNNEELIYLDRADKRFIVSPTRKQYAELTPEATGFQVPRSMTPGQIVEQLQRQRGYERVGEEVINGRPATKYRYANSSQTNTAAGEVKAEAFVYVDRETGLPLRSELLSEATGNVQGVKGLRIVTEMRDIQTNVEPTLFEVPTGLRQVSPEEVRQQVGAVVGLAEAVLRNVMSQNNTQSGTQNNTPNNAPGSTTTTPSPSPAVIPSAPPTAP